MIKTTTTNDLDGPNVIIQLTHDDISNLTCSIKLQHIAANDLTCLDVLKMDDILYV
jgi:hypothetical protein